MWRTAHHRMSCRESSVGRPGQLPASYKNQLHPMGTLDEDQARGTRAHGGG
jgi:hypothetical protein